MSSANAPSDTSNEERAMDAIRRRAHELADQAPPFTPERMVLLRGSSATGREVVADGEEEAPSRHQRTRGDSENTSSISDYTESLSVARELIDAGIPVFVAKPDADSDGGWNPAGGHNGTGYWFPSGWQKTESDLRERLAAFNDDLDDDHSVAPVVDIFTRRVLSSGLRTQAFTFSRIPGAGIEQ